MITRETMSLNVLAIVLMGATSLSILAGCKQDESTSPTKSASEAKLPDDLFTTTEPAGAKSVEEVKKTAKAGETVTVRGLIGGSMEPFVEGRAILMLMGSGLKPCNADPADKCASPWDYCCETPADIVVHSATIQVVDSNGAPLRLSLKGEHDVKELSELVVVGQVKQADQKVLIINATKMFVEKS